MGEGDSEGHAEVRLTKEEENMVNDARKQNKDLKKSSRSGNKRSGKFGIGRTLVYGLETGTWK
jgi:hypothetical protein